MADKELGGILELMADEYAREILARISREPLSVSDLKGSLDVSERTIHRRLDDLESHDMIEEDLEIDPDGHHRTLYRTAFQSMLVELTEGGYEVRIEFEENTADRFARIWGDIRKG